MGTNSFVLLKLFPSFWLSAWLPIAASNGGRSSVSSSSRRLWAAGGEPEDSEIEALRTCTGVLLRRWEREPKSAEYRDKAKEMVEGTVKEKSGSA